MNQYRPTSFSVLPTVVKNLLIINGIFFLATLALQKFNIDLRDILGLHYFGSEKFSPIQFITYMFLHANFGHIFFNLFAIWMFGYAIENYWGAKRFLVYYLITGFGAALIHYAVFYSTQMMPVLHLVDGFLANPSLDGLQTVLSSPKFSMYYEVQGLYNDFVTKYNMLVQTDPQQALEVAVRFMEQYRVEYLNAPVIIGASGALFGILLAFGWMFPNSRIYLYFAIPVKAKWLVIGYGLMEFFSGVSNNPGDSVAHWAHLGGMIFGFFLIRYWKVKPLN